MARMGRPLKTEEPKEVSLHLRITKSEAERIRLCAQRLGLNRTETIMQGIKRLEDE